MGLFSNLNTGKKFEFELEEALPKECYLSLAELDEDRKFLVRSIYRNTKSKFGEHYVILGDDIKNGLTYGINLPKFLNETIQQIFASEEMIEAINEAKVAFHRSDLRHTKSGKPYYTVIWLDL